MRVPAAILALWIVSPVAAVGELERAAEALRAGRVAEAEALLTRVLEADPGHLPARYQRARARARAGRWDEAAADYRAVLDRKPESAPSWRGLAEACEALGQPGEAFAAYRRALALQPGDPALRAAVARLAASSPPSAVASLPADATQPARLGPRMAVDVTGFRGVAQTALDASGGQLLDYTFAAAPTDWTPAGGTWAVSSRFACDPSWSFFGGHSRGLAIIWNKRAFAGDQVVEAYVSFKHGLPWNSRDWSYRPADLCLTLCGDGRDPDSGYSFIYGGDEGSRTLICRGDRVLAETREPQYLPPSYNDERPNAEDFHRRWWRLQAALTGDRLAFYVDGDEALTVTDPQPLRGGRIALWTVHNGMMVARVRVAYQQELRTVEPEFVRAEPVPLPPEPAVTVAAR